MKQENTTPVMPAAGFTGISMNRSWWFLILGLTTTVLWLLFAKIAVPPVIESVYRGESISLLNRAIAGQAEFPVEHYLQKWDTIAMSMLWSLLAFWLVAFLTSSEAFARRIVGETTPGTLGAMRMWTCAILLASTLWEDLGSISLLPLALREPMGLMKLFDEFVIGYRQFLTSEIGLRIFQWCTVLALFLGMIGWRTRVVVPLAAVCAFVLNGILREYSGFWHQNLVPIYVLAVLSFTPCGDGWSVDRLRNIYRGRPVPDSETPSAAYGWARYACWVPIALTYAAAGLTKLRADGLDWVSATNMRNLLYEQTLLPRAGNWSISLHLAPAPDFVFVVLGTIALCGELFYVTVLFSRTARRIFPAAQILMHIGIVFLQNIVFLDLILLNFLFYNFAKARQAIARWLRSRGALRVIYDGECAMCRRTIRLLAALDLFHRLDFSDFRRMDLGNFNARHGLKLRPEHLEKEIQVVSKDQASSGFYAYRAIALAVPALWPVAPGLFLPGVSALGGTLYGRVAQRRMELLTCDAACNPVSPVSMDATATPARPTPGRFRVIYGVAVAIVFVGMGYFWARQIEYYPFTAVPMFVGKKSDTVTYFKTLGHYESGAVGKIQLEDALGAWSINSRYESLFYLCFGEPESVDLCKKTLSILGTAYNKRAAPGERLTDLEIQRWKWDFRAAPEDPNYGHLDARFVGRIQQNGSR